ncbi:MAG: phosphate ABC transporter permease PstA [Actinomycetota bacterium]|nr:phosphate ABC transporter permease PstA [Actinomycetota bacterium]
MTASVLTSPRKPRPQDNGLTSGQLPRFFELYALGSSLLVVAGIFALMGFNLVGWLVVTALVYLVAVGVFSTIVENRRKATDRVVRGLVIVAFLLAFIPLVSTLGTVVIRGASSLNIPFITQSTHTAFDANTLKVTVTQGALQSIIGTLEITGIAALMSVPVGLLTSIYLVEYAQPTQWMPRTVTLLVDVMTGIPSIVAGLFAFSLFTLLVGPKAFSGFSASVALSVLMIPIVVRSSEEMLKLVSSELREASYALGVTKFRTITRIVLPTAIAGLVTGIMLAIARVIGETAPIFIAASFTSNFNGNPFSGPMSSLAVQAYANYKYPGTDIPASVSSAWGAALLLVLLVVILNLIARIIARIFAPKGLR